MNRALFLLGILIVSSDVLWGWIEPPHPPPDKLVQISDCIVIGHAKDDSLENPILIITEVLKGNPPVKEVPIVIPGSGAYMILQKDHTIWEGGDMAHPICGDIRQDQIWFLRTDPKGYSGEKSGSVLRIWEPGDIQPAELKPYYLAFMTDHPEEILKGYVEGYSVLARASRAYVDPIEIDRISKIPNPSDRIDKLIPYLLFRESFNPKENDETAPNSETMPTITDVYNLRGNDAKKQLIVCGNGVGEKLEPIFLDPNYEFMRMEIMTVWAALDYKNATPLVVSLLEQEDQHWAHPDVPHPIDNDRANSWSRLRITCALNTLAALGDPRAKEVILLTKKRWIGFGSADPSQAIVPACNNALRQIESSSAKSH